MIRRSRTLACSLSVTVLATAAIVFVDLASARPESGRSSPQAQAEAASSSGVSVFLPPVAYDAAATQSKSIAVGDVNGDGHPDLIVASWGTGASDGVISIMLGNGDGSFSFPKTYNSGGKQPTGIAVADVNGDGKPDLLVANLCNSGNGCSNTAAGVLLGNGDGTFQAAVSYNGGGSFNSLQPVGGSSMVAGDLNGDGKLDLVITSGSGNSNGDGVVGVLLGNGDGTFQAAKVSDPGGVSTSGIALGDMDGDGKLDLVVSNFGVFNSSQGSLATLLGNGDGTFQPAVLANIGGNPLALTLADLNGDGRLDVLAANYCGSGANNTCTERSVVVFLGNGDGSLRNRASFAAGSEAMSVALADVDGDGIPDAIMGLQIGEIGVLLGKADGTFMPPVLYSSGGNVAVAADLNGDNRPDVAVVQSCRVTPCEGSVGVLLNNTGPHIPTTISVRTSPSPTAGSVGFFAQVSAETGTPTGTVTFYFDSKLAGTARLVGGSADMGRFLPPGSHLITATYSGSVTYGPSTSAPVTQVIEFPTNLTLTDSPGATFVGQPVTFTATITSKYGTIPDGETVTFYHEGVLGTGTTVGGVATLTVSGLPVRENRITAIYRTDGVFEQKIGDDVHEVDPNSSSIALTSSPNPSNHDQEVTFTATVTSSGGGTPVGKVAFKDGGIVIGSANLIGGVATFARRFSVGSHSITAHYRGNPGLTPSDSPVLIQIVN